MWIQKLGKKKDAVRINSEKDIPEFLRDTIKIKDGQLEITCVEGVEHAPLGHILGFETTEKTSTGYNAWVIADESRVVERDGVFYAAPKPCQAELVGAEVPEMMREVLESGRLVQNEDGSFDLKTSWGVSHGEPDEALFVMYGPGDFNILTMSEKSFQDYMLCTPDGQDICPLPEFIEKLKAERDHVLSQKQDQGGPGDDGDQGHSQAD